MDSLVSAILATGSTLERSFIDLAPKVLLGIGRWLYDWQVLIAGICALIAARNWGRAIVKAAQMRAVGPEGSDKSAKPRRGPPRASSARAPDLRADESEALAARPLETLQALRARIRAVLCKVPCSDDLLSSAQLAFCKAVGTFSLSDVSLKANEAIANEHSLLQSELSALAALDVSASCKMAWQALININRSARALELMINAAAPRFRATQMWHNFGADTVFRILTIRASLAHGTFAGGR